MVKSLIISGKQGSGKTTLARKISDLFVATLWLEVRQIPEFKEHILKCCDCLIVEECQSIEEIEKIREEYFKVRRPYSNNFDYISLIFITQKEDFKFNLTKLQFFNHIEL